MNFYKKVLNIAIQWVILSLLVAPLASAEQQLHLRSAIDYINDNDYPKLRSIIKAKIEKKGIDNEKFAKELNIGYSDLCDFMEGKSITSPIVLNAVYNKFPTKVDQIILDKIFDKIIHLSDKSNEKQRPILGLSSLNFKRQEKAIQHLLQLKANISNPVKWFPINSMEKQIEIDPNYLRMELNGKLFDLISLPTKNQPGNNVIREVCSEKFMRPKPWARITNFAQCPELTTLLLADEIARRKIVKGDTKDKFCDLNIKQAISIGLEGLINDSIKLNSLYQAFKGDKERREAVRTILAFGTEENSYSRLKNLDMIEHLKSKFQLKYSDTDIKKSVQYLVEKGFLTKHSKEGTYEFVKKFNDDEVKRKKDNKELLKLIADIFENSQTKSFNKLDIIQFVHAECQKSIKTKESNISKKAESIQVETDTKKNDTK